MGEKGWIYNFFFKSFFLGQKNYKFCLKKKHLGGSTLPDLTLTILFWEMLQFSKQKNHRAKFCEGKWKIA
jgi:hypothetical protein